MKAVLWDLDDTLLNTLPERMKALQHAYELCVGGRIDPLELWKSHRGGTLEALGWRLMGEDFRVFTETYRQHYYGQLGRGAPFEGVKEVLDALRDHGLMLAVVTSKISWGAIEELESAGLLRYFGAVIGHDDTEKAKPDPEPIFEAMTRLVVDDPETVLFVGDSPADMYAARNAGCHSAAAMWGTLDESLLLECGPEYVARKPADVLDALSSLLSEDVR
jgi:HAD superfamily hydrolase (TIGR01509 family)